MAVVQNLTATILIQVGADEPKPIGTIEIPIELNLSPGKPAGLTFPPGVRGGSLNNVPGYRGIPDDDWLTDEQVPPITKIS